MAVGGTILVIVTVAVAALVLGLGAANPPVAGPVIWSDQSLIWSDGPAARAESGSGYWWTAPTKVSTGAGAFTLSVEATVLRRADVLAAWGVWVANADDTRTLYALNASGYWTIRTCPADAAAMVIDDCPAPSPEWRWLAHPHIHSAGEPNTITLHREDAGRLRLRINDELLGAPVVRTGGEWGVWARSNTVGPVIAWGAARLSGERAG